MIPQLGFGVSGVFGGYAFCFPKSFPTRLPSTGTGYCYNVARFITALEPLLFGQLAVLFASSGFAMPLRPAAICFTLVYVPEVTALPLAPETKSRPLPE
jgi:hypothetical protein